MKIYHNPPHIYLDNTIYFITAHTYKEGNYFNTDEKKQILLNRIAGSIERYQFKLYAYVILDNHYHSLIEVTRGSNLGNFINIVHGSSSHEINKIDNCQGRKIWYSYWDTCVRNNKDFFIRLNYIHNNPIKHGYVTDLEKLEQYVFSSYPIYLREKGRDWVNDVFLKFPVIDYTVCEPEE